MALKQRNLRSTPLLMRYLTILFVTLPVLLGGGLVNAQSWQIEQRTPFNVKLQQTKTDNYQPLQHSQKNWKVCALVPHLKDAYWIGIDYGLVEHAKTLNITLELFEAGSYYGKKKQLKQLSYCMQQDYDAILLGSVAPNLLSKFQEPITKPIIALVNRIDSHKVSSRVGVNWYQMGWNAGDYIRRDVEASRQSQANVALLTGPEKQGGSDWVELGITTALQQNPKIKISSIRHADNNRNLYRDQLHHLLNDQTPDYILGSAVAIEAAIGELTHRQAHGSFAPQSLQAKQVDKSRSRPEVKLVSSYLSPAVLRGLFRNKVAYSCDDLVVLQGKLAIDVVVRELEGAKAFGDIGPAIQGLEGDVLKNYQLSDSLAPADFYPIYRVVGEKR
ncbi:TMAO reductase system periplasmic protein TorT [Shewanella sp. UCD-KL12]|uniref:TMAO reductase system periplasmic protein TorT n=1 Tax=Shewanella sp. UCD-KL12 TaxID=1917163 RepID=UPI0009FA3A5B